jgi:hypothetical protein
MASLRRRRVRPSLARRRPLTPAIAGWRTNASAASRPTMNTWAVNVAAAPLHCPSRLPVEGGKAHQNLPDGSDRLPAPLTPDGMPTLSAPLDCR